MAAPQFAYGNTAPNPTTNTYPLLPGNAAPALVVWLFLVTDPSFLAEINRVQTTPGSAYNPAVLPIDSIAQYTNLTPDAVKSVFDSFATAGVLRQLGFQEVSSAFQDLAKQNNPAWQPGDCPHGAAPMLSLAKQGASVNPSTATLPPLP